MANKIENTKEVLIYCSPRLSLAAFMKIVAIVAIVPVILSITSYVAVFVQLHLRQSSICQ